MLEDWLRAALQVWSLLPVEQISDSTKRSSGVCLAKEHTMSISTNRSVFGEDWYLVWGFEDLKAENKTILELEIKFLFI